MKSSWKYDYGDGLNVTALREKFSPADKFRVSPRAFPAGTTTGGSMLAGKCFVFAGTVEYRFDGCTVQLRAGEWAELPAGGYELKVGEDADADFVMVWEIPPM